MDFTQRHQATILNPFDENMRLRTGIHVFNKEAIIVLSSVFVFCLLGLTIWQSTHPIYLDHPNPSHFIFGLKTLPAIEVPYHGISLRPRLEQDT